MSNDLTASQARFALMIKAYPWLSKFWDWQKCEVDLDRIHSAMGVMSSGERVLTCFFLSLWTGSNQSFDITDAAATLDKSERQLIADWLLQPFWP